MKPDFPPAPFSSAEDTDAELKWSAAALSTGTVLLLVITPRFFFCGDAGLLPDELGLAEPLLNTSFLLGGVDDDLGDVAGVAVGDAVAGAVPFLRFFLAISAFIAGVRGDGVRLRQLKNEACYMIVLY